MKLWLAVTALSAVTCAVAAGGESVPLYTNDDLDRMFGAPLPSVTDPVDKSGPQDWEWVEGFIDRQYAHIEADRQYDLQRRAADLIERREERFLDDYDTFGRSYILPGAYYWGGGYLGWRGGAYHRGWQGSGGGWHGIPGMRPINRPAPLPTPRANRPGTGAMRQPNGLSGPSGSKRDGR